MAITNTRAKLASVRPANTTEVQLYAVPAATEIDAIIRVVNQDSVSRTCGVAHTTAAHGDVAADTDDWIVPNGYTIPAYDFIIIPIIAGPTETIRIKSGTADVVSFHLSGNKKVTS